MSVPLRAWDQSKALKRQLWPTPHGTGVSAKALTPVDTGDKHGIRSPRPVGSEGFASVPRHDEHGHAAMEAVDFR
ncbi:hypothetical protein PSAB6_360012 [Paraburkholderia sabiae]|nr:hypothetical protein PSAB6_360012 [Paraburkholderia sabiae]